MRQLARIVSVVALAGTILPALLYFTDRLDLVAVKQWMLVSTIVWFIATPQWMDRGRA
jgi:hypothetical protein